MRRHASNVLVVGGTGCLGRAIVQALRSRGHRVIEASRRTGDTPHSMCVDYMRPTAPDAWAARLRAARVDVVINAAGLLMESRNTSFARVHAQGPIELFEGALRAGVRRVVQVSALGASRDGSVYASSKCSADDALLALGPDAVVLRPSLVYGPHSPSTALFATLASLPLIALPGRGDQPLAPIHVYEVAEVCARLVEHGAAVAGVVEIGGPRVIGYREMLATYRAALGLRDPLWLPTPLAPMRVLARCAEALPQRVVCRETVRMLEAGSVPRENAAAAWLGRPPTPLERGLDLTPPEPWLDLHVRIAPPLEWLVRAGLAFMWLWTAAISLLLPQASGVLELLARCGLDGQLGIGAMFVSCALNITLGVLVLRPAAAWNWSLQAAAVIGYTSVAAWNMPELTIDHCGPLAKNIPVLAIVALMACAQRAPLRSPLASDSRPRPRSRWALRSTAPGH